jgi:hypothetical protein
MGLATFKKKDIFDKISLLSDDQIKSLERTVDLMLTPNKE